MHILLWLALIAFKIDRIMYARSREYFSWLPAKTTFKFKRCQPETFEVFFALLKVLHAKLHVNGPCYCFIGAVWEEPVAVFAWFLQLFARNYTIQVNLWSFAIILDSFPKIIMMLHIRVNFSMDLKICGWSIKLCQKCCQWQEYWNQVRRRLSVRMSFWTISFLKW